MKISVVNQVNKIANEQMNNFLRKRITSFILGGEFVTQSQKNIVSKFLLNNDTFQKVAKELYEKTGAHLVVSPISKANPGIEMKIFEGKNLFDWFAKNKNGGLIFETLDPRVSESENKYFLNKFIETVNNYILTKN